MGYTPAQRRQISEEATGKVVASLEYDDDPSAGYWVMTFTDDSEITFRFRLMAEIGA
jgi:hypothetical protein